jgi:predicted TIM-barrel fold metal-dependent hydrolase
MPPADFFDKAEIDPYLGYMIETGAIDGEFDIDIRLKELAREGVAAEVVFPQAIPFQVPFGDADPELLEAGQRAYNRWISEFVAQCPGRIVGQASVSLRDVDAAIATVEWATEHGLKSVMLPGIEQNAPRLH